jgi:hypothetical protein
LRDYHLATGLYLERFDDAALVLVCERNLLLTVDAAAAELFTEVSRSFGSCSFTLEQGIDWLAGGYDLDAQQCRIKARELLAFALRNGLVCQANAER